MKSSICRKCGLNVGSHQVHPDDACKQQQEVNRLNLGLGCQWCGSKGTHKSGCPTKISIENVEDLEDYENEYGKFHSYSDEEMDQFMK